MNERWMGLVVTSQKAVCVEIEFNAADEPTLVADRTILLQEGDRPAAYHAWFENLRDQVSQNGVGFVAIKSSLASRRSTPLSHFEGAELRGVTAAAASAGGASVEMVNKAGVSRRRGHRKVDEYVGDDSFWNGAAWNRLRKGSREAALLVLVAKGVA